MVGKAVTHTKEDKKRFQLLPQIGCICCKSYGVHNEWVQIHHIIDGNKRMGHQYTLPLCYWHHQGVPPEGLTRKQAEDMVGPSLISKKRFNEVFGGEMELLEYVNKFLDVIEDSIV
ncbi:Ref family recombination enhancement nuclease [Sinomicrobium sp.]